MQRLTSDPRTHILVYRYADPPSPDYCAHIFVETHSIPLVFRKSCQTEHSLFPLMTESAVCAVKSIGLVMTETIGYFAFLSNFYVKMVVALGQRSIDAFDTCFALV